MSKRIMLLLSLALGGCLFGPVLVEGTYRMEVAVQSDTCGVSEGYPGEGYLASVRWKDDETLVTDGLEGKAEYEWDGATLHREETETMEYDGACHFRMDDSYDGEVLDQESFYVAAHFEFSVVGDCSSYDTTGQPCSIKLDYDLELVE